ncbi:hypothetical protein [Catenovulum sediminis]|nr:hypothetical protein [Catenovulum sediminis]
MIAFGNALGNSIVEGMSAKPTSKTQAKKTADEAYTNAIQSGASEKEATYAAAKAVAKENGGTISNGGSGGNSNSGGSGSSGSGPKLNGSIVGIDETKGFYLSNGSDNAFFNYGDGVLNHVTDFLKGSPAAGLAYKFAFTSVQGNQRIEASYQAGIARGIHNYNVGKANRVTTGNIIDMNDSATRMAFARNEGTKTTRELQAVSLQLVGGIATLPSLVTGIGALGNLALRGMVNLVPQVGHGLMTLGRASVNLADDMVLHAGTYARSAIWQANPLSLAQTEITKVALRKVALQAGQNARVGLTGTAGSLNTQLGNLAANKTFQSVIQQGGVNGATNLAADLAFNGVDGSNPFKSFTTGFIGGAMFGGARNPVLAGMGTSLTTEFLDQRWEQSMGREEINYDHLILATFAGGAAGFGLNKYFSSSNWVPKNFGAFADESFDSFIGNYGNNVFSNWSF